MIDLKTYGIEATTERAKVLSAASSLTKRSQEGEQYKYAFVWMPCREKGMDINSSDQSQRLWSDTDAIISYNRWA